MNDVTQIINAIKPIAAKLGQGGVQLYKAYYRQTVLNGIESLIVSLGILISLGALLSWLRKATNVKSDENKFQEIEGSSEALVVVSIVCGVIAIFVVFAGIIPGVNDLLNPNYQTIQNIISQIK